jgi:tetratricopeptide (TPR) repeat protein
MERSKYFIVIIAVLLSLSSVGQSNKVLIYNAYISNKMSNWKIVLDKMIKIDNPNLTTRFEILDYQYGYIAWCVGTGRDDEAEKYLELAWKNADFLEIKKYKLSSVYAYKSAFYGYEIGLNTMMAPFYGPKSKKYMNKAMEADPNDPLGFMQYANSEFYMPAAFGGSKIVAVENYKKSILKMEKIGNLQFNWNYLSLLAITGQALEAIDKPSEAKLYYQKALKFEPNFLWVKNDLLPKLLKKLNNGK